MYNHTGYVLLFPHFKIGKLRHRGSSNMSKVTQTVRVEVVIQMLVVQFQGPWPWPPCCPTAWILYNENVYVFGDLLIFTHSHILSRLDSPHLILIQFFPAPSVPLLRGSFPAYMLSWPPFLESKITKALSLPFLYCQTFWNIHLNYSS